MQPREQCPVTEVPDEGWKQVSTAAGGWCLSSSGRNPGTWSRGLWHLKGGGLSSLLMVENSCLGWFC